MITLLLIVIYLAFISLGLPDSLLGSVWPLMWQDIDASFSSAGIISMVIAGSTILSSLSTGYIVDKLGTGAVTLLSCLLTAVALLGISFAPSLLWLLLLAIPLGLGAGAVDSSLNNYVAQHFEVHHMNWLHCFWGVGATLGPVIMSYNIAQTGSWRSGYVVVACIQFALVAILLIALPLWKKTSSKQDESINKPNEQAAMHSSEANLQEAASKQKKRTHVLSLKGFKPTLLAFLLYCGVESMVGLWGASFLVGAREFDAERAAGWVALYYGGITLGRLITGFIAMKVNNLILIRSGQVIAIVGGIALLLPQPAPLFLAGLILIGLGLAPIFPGLLHETPARFGKENSAKLMGYQMAVAYTGSTFLPPLFGVLAAKTNISLLPIIVLILLVLMLLSAELVNRVLASNSNIQQVNE